MKAWALFLGIFLLTPGFALGQEAKPDSCESIDVKAPTEWIGSPPRNVNIRVGPGIDYPIHQSGELFAGEEIQILQECHGWLQARSMPEHLIGEPWPTSGNEKNPLAIHRWGSGPTATVSAWCPFPKSWPPCGVSSKAGDGVGPT